VDLYKIVLSYFLNKQWRYSQNTDAVSHNICDQFADFMKFTSVITTSKYSPLKLVFDFPLHCHLADVFLKLCTILMPFPRVHLHTVLVRQYTKASYNHYLLLAALEWQQGRKSFSM